MTATDLSTKLTNPLLQTSLVNTLERITNEIIINSNSSVTHSQFGDFNFTVKDRIDEQFQQLSSEVQQQYLSVKLQNLLHDLYYRQSKTKPVDIEETHEEDKLENQATKWKKRKFFQELHQHNFGEGYFESDWQVIGEEKNDLLPVRKNDLTLHISPSRHLQPSDRQAKMGDFVAVQMPVKTLEPGYYIAVGDGGKIDFQNSDLSNDLNISDRHIINIYFHITALGAVTLMSSLTQQLNKIKIPFNFKVLYNSDDYPIEDAATLSIERQYYEVVCPILQEIYVANRAYFQPEIPLFTKLLAPGLSLAEEPNFKNSELENFGLHYFQPIARGLIASWQQKSDLTQDKVKLILEFFAEQQINSKYPYLNVDSEDIYQFLI
jgi:hypothetical protein